MSSLFTSFAAFNMNAAASLQYLFTANIWLFLLMASCIATIIINLFESIEYSVSEQQRIL